jgi:hypothetical protein
MSFDQNVSLLTSLAHCVLVVNVVSRTYIMDWAKLWVVLKEAGGQNKVGDRKQAIITTTNKNLTAYYSDTIGIYSTCAVRQCI